MRIAGMGFARIRGPQGTYALLLNKGRLHHNGERILSPVGGALEPSSRGRAFLTSRHQAQFEPGNDLRFWVPDDQVDAVVAWFVRCRQRETSVWRELLEELTDETHLLLPLDLEGYAEGYGGFTRYNAQTRRPVEDPRTAYLIDTFDVRLPERALSKLLVASRGPIDWRWIYFATRDEVEAGTTTDGMKIGPITKAIL